MTLRVVLAAAMIAAVVAARAAAADDNLDALEQQAMAAAVERVAPCVVGIQTIGGMERVHKVLFGTGPTTGLVIDPQGYIVSSAFNFVNKPASILVRLPDGGAPKSAKLVATDHNRKIVLLKIEAGRPLPTPEIAPEADLRVGQWCIGVGRTFQPDQPNMSVGILSATGRIWGKALQTDAASSPNNYGGPLIDIRGRVLGVIVPLSPQSADEVAGYEWYDSGIGFAVPAEYIRKVLLPKLKKGRDLYPGLAGFTLQSRDMNASRVVIAACRSNSPAANAGLRSGDQIVEIAGRKVARQADLMQELSRRYAGDKVKIAALRDGTRIETEMQLIDKLDPYQHPLLGILPLRTAKGSGVKVRYVYPQSPAARAGIVAGDVLLRIAGKAVAGRDALLQQMAALEAGQETEIEFRHPDQAATSGFSLMSLDQQGFHFMEDAADRGPTRTVKVTLDRLPEGLPPAELPPAHPPIKPGKAKSEKAKADKAISDKVKSDKAKSEKAKADKATPGGPKPGNVKPAEVGVVLLAVPEAKQKVWAYVPDGYRAVVPHGLVIWLHGKAAATGQELLARWKPLCDRYDLIVAAPRGDDAADWKVEDATLVGSVIQQIGAAYRLDPTRVVICGQESGGTLACMMAFRGQAIISAAAVIDATPMGQPPENQPMRRLAMYVGSVEKSPHAAATARLVAQLRTKKIPVTLKGLGNQPRELTHDELDELVRWIDMLDRI
jgi:serine protease Do